jgi:hypothetical protein
VILAVLGSCPARPLVRQVCALEAAPPAFDDGAAGALRAQARAARASVLNRGTPSPRWGGARRSRRFAAKDGCVVLGYRRDGCSSPRPEYIRSEARCTSPICCVESASSYRGRGRRAASASRPRLPSRVARQRDRTPDERVAAPGPVGSCLRTSSAALRVDRGPSSSISSVASRVTLTSHREGSRR